MHWSPTKRSLLHRGVDFTPRAQGNAPEHKWSLPPQKRYAPSPTLPFEHNFPSKLAGRKKGEKASCGKKNGLTLFKALPQGKRKPNEQSFPNWPFLIPTLPLLLKCWCWLHTTAVKNYAGSVISPSPLLSTSTEQPMRRGRQAQKEREWHGSIWWLLFRLTVKTKNATPKLLNLHL